MRDDFAAIARRNVEAFFGGPHPAWTLRVGDVADCAETGYRPDHPGHAGPLGDDRPAVDRALVPGGVFIGYVATTPQLSELVEALREHGGFTEPRAWETLVRDWHADGLAVRPDHRMIAHTAFLISVASARTRRDRAAAPAQAEQGRRGVRGPARRRRTADRIDAQRVLPATRTRDRTGRMTSFGSELPTVFPDWSPYPDLDSAARAYLRDPDVALDALGGVLAGAPGASASPWSASSTRSTASGRRSSSATAPG